VEAHGGHIVAEIGLVAEQSSDLHSAGSGPGQNLKGNQMSNEKVLIV